MSYAYNVYGVDRRIDYSRQNVVNYDWQSGRDLGRLTFVTGQHGERADMYDVGDGLFGADGELPDEASVEELLAAAPADAKQAFLAEFASPEDQLGALRGRLISSIGHEGTRRSMVAKVDAALSSLTRGDSSATCGQLHALLEESQAQARRFASAADAEDARLLISGVRTLIECP